MDAMSGFGFVDRAHSLTGPFGATDRIAPFQIRFCPIGDLFERMPLEALQRQNFAGRIFELQRAKGHEEYGEIE